MVLNRYQINLNTFPSGSTTTYFTIPINLEYQLVDQNDIVKRIFVDVETEKAINPIIDYEKIRFSPSGLTDNIIDKIVYNVILTGGTTYADIGFDNDDIKFQKETFKQTFLKLNFYDSDNPLNQNLVSNVTLFSELKPADLHQINSSIGFIGQTLPASQIPLSFVLDSSIYNPNSFAQGFFLYDYKDEINVGDSKYLYMRASFKNAKNGVSTNLMVKLNAQPIDTLIHELYTRYVMVRTDNGYFYQIDDTYQGNLGTTGSNNITYDYNSILNSVTVNLYQILAL